MDPAKLKVVELRAELAALGLDTKGNKPVLVERLKQALASDSGGVQQDASSAEAAPSGSAEELEESSEETTPSRTRRPRRRQSSSGAPSTPTTPTTPNTPNTPNTPTTPVRASRRDVNAEKTPPVREISQAVDDDSSDSNQECPLSEIASQPAKIESPAASPTPAEPAAIEPSAIEPQSSPAVEPEPVKIAMTPATEPEPVPEKTETLEEATNSTESLQISQPDRDNEVVEKMEGIEVLKSDGAAAAEEESAHVQSELDISSTQQDSKNKEQEILESKDEASQPKNEKEVISENLESTNENETDKPKSEKEEEKDDNKKDRRRREKHSRWSGGHQNNESSLPDNDVQVTGEYISIRDDDEDKGRGRNRRPQKRAREPSPRRKSIVRVPEPEIPADKVTISWYDSDLNLHIDVPDLNVGVPLNDSEFAHCWAGARASHGVTQGKVCFEVRIESMLTPAENCPPGIRFGWSTTNSSLHLGDSLLSWGFEHSGRKVTNSTFEDYGTALKEKDVVGAYVDLESNPCTITYTVNGESQGAAFEFEKDILEGNPLFPHILSRNCCYRVNFGHDKYALLTKTKVIKRQVEIPIEGDKVEKNIASEVNTEEVKMDTDKKDDGEEKYDPMKCSDDEQDVSEEKLIEEDKPKDDKPEESKEKNSEAMEIDEQSLETENKDNESIELKPGTMIRIEADIEIDGEEAQMLDGYILIGKISIELLVPGPQKIPKEEQCEVIMMCGLPGSGKTYWSQKYATDHPEKRFNILGTHSLVEKMKIDCKPFKSVYDGKWNVLISNVTKCVAKLIDIAQNRRRNYILDQTSVYPSAQRRKMREFIDCKRTAIVIVPDEATYQERQRLREEKDGKDVADGSVLEMKANFGLPEKCSWMDEVIFSELNEEESKKMLEKYNKEGRSAGYGGNPGNGRSGRSRSGGGSHSSSGAPPQSKRSRFDNSNDRGRRGGPDRGRHGSGPGRNRNDSRRDDRRGGGGGAWRGRHGGDWGGGGWGGPRDQSYGRDHQSYGRDQSYNRDQPYGRDNRSRDGGPGGGPYRGNNDRWGNRGGSHNRDSRGGGGGMEGRGRAGMIDHRGDRNDRGGKASWGSQPHRGGGGGLGGGPRNQPQIQSGRSHQARPNGPQGQSRGGDSQGGNWSHQSQSSGTGWSQQQQSGGGSWNHQGSWPQQGYGVQWGGYNSGWSKFQGQQAGGQGQQNQQSNQGQWNQWNQWNAQQSYWAQWPVQQKDNQLKGAAGTGDQATAGDQTVATPQQAAAAQQNPQLWAQYQYNPGYGTNMSAGNANNSGAQDKK